MSGADDIIAGLLQGTGFGRTVADDSQQNAQIQGQQLQNQAQQQQIQQVTQQQALAAQQQQKYQSWESDYAANPTPNKLLTGMVQFPDKYQALKAAHDAKDSATQTADLGYWSGVSSALGAGQNDIAATTIQNRIAAEKAAGLDTSVDEQYLAGLKSGDKPTINALKAASLAGIAVATGPDKFASTYKAVADNANPDATKGQVVGRTIGHYEGTKFVTDYRDPDPESTRVIKNADGSESIVQLGGGGLASSGSGTAGTGDVSRLVNTDAGGGYVPDSVKTLGQFVTYGKALNQKGAKSSSAGTYQINGSTMAEFGPKVLGQDWKTAPFNADTQDKIGEGIFDWAKQQPNPAAALRGRWVSLSPQSAAQLVQGSWDQAKGTIAQGETGGAPGSSASVPAAGDGGARVVYTGKGAAAGAPDDVTGPAYKAYLSPGRAALAQAVIDGRAPAPRPGSKYGEALAEDVARIDPTADATTLPMRQKVRTAFNASGQQGQAMQAYNRFAAHLNSAWALHQQLGGPNLGPLSGVAASIGQSFSPGLVNKYNTEIEGLQGEFQKLTKLGVANEGEANRLIAAAKPNQSADGRAGALQGMAELVAGAYQPAVQSWHAAFPDRPLPIDVAPGAKAVINNVLHGGKDALPVDHTGAPYHPVNRPQQPGFGTGGGSQGAPAGAIQMLKSNPALRGAFEAKYGAGSAARVLGQ